MIRLSSDSKTASEPKDIDVPLTVPTIAVPCLLFPATVKAKTTLLLLLSNVPLTPFVLAEAKTTGVP